MSVQHAHVILYVEDQKRSAEFYGHVLSIEPTLDVPGMTEFPLGDGTLGLMPEEGIARLLSIDPAAGRPPRAELYLRVPDPDAYYARSLAAGAVELSPLRERGWGDSVAYVQDPDGHVLAFAKQRQE